ncbi:MAG: four helix bundle suffix domain-containing protein [Bacteroidales bacterium]|jgi:four helix bundle suffix protein|nr:four helix bundle suffix domain-containing protein [Bacteroidales bacterium]
MDNNSLYRNHGNYRKLHSYQKAEAIYDITCFFCERFLKRGDRTIDQMVQAARSGKQNIIEGCKASATSAETEIKLVNVAKASLHELWADYEDYLRKISYTDPVKGRLWETDSAEAKKMYELGCVHNDAAFYMKIVMTRPPETIANIAICLLRGVDYLLFRQLQSLEKKFLAEGGMRERMTRLRTEERNRQNNSRQSPASSSSSSSDDDLKT